MDNEPNVDDPILTTAGLAADTELVPEDSAYENCILWVAKEDLALHPEALSF